MVACTCAHRDSVAPSTHKEQKKQPQRNVSNLLGHQLGRLSRALTRDAVQRTPRATLVNMTQFLLRRLLKASGPSTVHGRLAGGIEAPAVHDRVEEMNAQLRALEVKLDHKGQDPKVPVQAIESKMSQDIGGNARGD